MADLSVAKPRINASLFGKYQGKVVTVMGTAHDTDSDGMGFQLKTSDNQDIHVKLSEQVQVDFTLQLQDYAEGLVEVQGVVNGKEIDCFNHVQFPPEASNNFDMDAYNKAVTFMSQHPQLYFQKDGYPQTQ